MIGIETEIELLGSGIELHARNDGTADQTIDILGGLVPLSSEGWFAARIHSYASYTPPITLSPGDTHTFHAPKFLEVNVRDCTAKGPPSTDAAGQVVFDLIPA